MSSYNETIEELRRLINSYFTTLQVKRSVLERLRQLESRRVRSRRARHAISGLRSTLRHLEDREITLLRTIDVKIASIVGDISIDNVRVVPCYRVCNSSSCYRVDKVNNIDIVKVKTAFRDENIDLEKSGFIPEHPKILVNFDKLSGRVEFIVHVISYVINKLSQFKLPLHIVIKKVQTEDLDLVKEVIRHCFEAEGVLEVFVPGDLTFYLSSPLSE